MSSLVYLVPLALLLGGLALAAFFWSLRNGQYDDLDGAAERILLNDED
jgi:cbb3-type cytochrome oxidase maturation protein